MIRILRFSLKFWLITFHQETHISRIIYSVDTGQELNVHKTFRRRPGRLLNVLCTSNSRPCLHGEWTKHKIIFLKSANKYQITLQCHNFKNILIDDFLYHLVLYRAKIFYGTGNNKLQRRDDSSFKHLLYDFF